MVVNRKVLMLLIVFGTMGNLGLTFHQYVMFVRAYASPEKAIILFIDKFHEANIELVLMTITMVLGIISTYYVLRNVKTMVP